MKPHNPCGVLARRAALVAATCALAAGCAEGGSVTAVATKTSTTIASTSEARTSEASTAEGSTPVSVGEATAGTDFSDPDGSYTITLGPGWSEAPTRPVKEVEQWVVADARNGFAPNVNVLTQDVPGMTLQDYIDVSLEGMAQLEVLDSSVIDLDDGGQLGRIEYAGTLGAGTSRRELHFLAIFAVVDDEAVVATLTAGENDFEKLRVENERYLRTLRHT